MPAGDKYYVEALHTFGCRPAINESLLGDAAVLYRAASCNGTVSQLDMRVAGQYAEIFIAKSAAVPTNFRPYRVGEFVDGLEIRPADYIRNVAQTNMSVEGRGIFTDEYIKKCQARAEPGLGANAYVVDSYPAGQLPQSADGPRSACGFYGYTEESRRFWSLGEKNAWFFELGQDAYTDFDPETLVLIARNNSGKWVPVNSVAQQLTTAASIADDYTATNIAGVPDSVETPYGETRGYTVYSGNINSTVKYCVGEKDFHGTTFRIGFDGGQWQIAVPYTAPADYYGSFEVDGKGWGMSGTTTDNWTFWWMGLPELDALRNGNELVMNIERASLDFHLSGSAAVITKIEECYSKLR